MVLGQRAEPVTPEARGTTGPGVYKIAGQERSFDMVFKCVGFRTAHAPFITPLGDVTTANGCIDVNSSFQVRALSFFASKHELQISNFKFELKFKIGASSLQAAVLAAATRRTCAL